MKTRRYVIGCLLLNWLTFASAQTDVTIYGAIDASVESIKSGDASLIRLIPGGSYQSRVGIRGSEDLGGGARAIFNIENRFTVDDGAQVGGLLFGGRSVVGLSGGWGTVVAGREYIPLYQVKVAANPFGYNTYSPAQIMMTGGATRSNNALRYDSPSFAGLSVGALYGLGNENASNPQAGRQKGLSAQYVIGDTWLGAAANHVSVKSATADSTAEYMVGVRHKLKDLSLYTNYWRYRTRDTTGVGAAASQVMLGLAAKVSASGTVLAAYSTRKGVVTTPGAENKANQWAVGYAHSLSKRTTLYAQYITVDNKGQSNVDVSDLNNTGSAATGYSNPRALMVGLRHLF